MSGCESPSGDAHKFPLRINFHLNPLGERKVSYNSVDYSGASHILVLRNKKCFIQILHKKDFFISLVNISIGTIVNDHL